jgi:hypothetical protein
MTQVMLAVELGPGAWACAIVDVVEPTAGAGGTKQAAWHIAACELQVIMQLVVVEVCARRIFSPADASLAKPANATTASRTAQHRMTASTGFQSPIKLWPDTIAR